MKRILAFPDVHQDLATFNKFKDKIDEYDYFVFLGDYVDSFGERLRPPLTTEEAYAYLRKGYIKLRKHVWYSGSDYWWLKQDHNPIRVMEALIDFKNQHPDKVKLLIGNHDFSYHHLTPSNGNVSGHQPLHQIDLCDFYVRNKDNFDVSFYTDGLLFSHAGFGTKFVERLKESNDYKGIDEVSSLVNDLYHKDCVLLDHCGNEPSGNSLVEGPLWIRPESLVYNNGFSNVWQIVGHTEMRVPLCCTYQNNKGVWFIDSFNHDNVLEITCSDDGSYMFVNQGTTSETSLHKVLDSDIDNASKNWIRWRSSLSAY